MSSHGTQRIYAITLVALTALFLASPTTGQAVTGALGLTQLLYEFLDRNTLVGKVLARIRLRRRGPR